MFIFKNRPLMTASLAYVIIFVVCSVLNVSPLLKLISGIALLIVTLLCILAKSSRKTDKISYAAIFLISLFALSSLISSYVYSNVFCDSVYSYAGGTHNIEGRIISCKTSSVSAEILSVDGKDITRIPGLSFRTELSCFGVKAKENDLIKAKVQFSEYDKDGFFDENTYKRSNGYYLRSIPAENETVTVIGKAKNVGLFPFLYSLAEKLNLFLFGILKKYLSVKNCGFVSALILGNKELLQGSVKNCFSYLGLPHVLAISGVHFSLIFGMLSAVLRLTGLGRKSSCAVLIPFSAAFMLLCGLSSSVVRAGIMFIIICICRLFGHESDSFTSLFFAVAIIIAFDPPSMFDTGLILSFLATLGIISASSVLRGISESEKLSGFSKYVLTSLSATAFAVIFTLPAVWLMFGKISLLSPLANLAVSPFISLIIYISPFIFIFSFFSPIADIFAATVSAVCRILFFITESMAKISGASISLNRSFSPYLFALLAIALIILFILQPKKSVIYPSVCLSFAVIFIICSFAEQIPDRCYEYICTDDCDSAFAVSKSHACIFDGGMSYSDASEICDRISDTYKICQIDVIAVLSPDRYTGSALKKILSDFKVFSVCLPIPCDGTEAGYIKDICDICDSEGVNIRFCESGSKCIFHIGKLTVSICCAGNDRRCLAYRIDCGERSLCYIQSTESDLIADGNSSSIFRNSDAVIFGKGKGKYKSFGKNDILVSSHKLIFADPAAPAFFAALPKYKGKINYLPYEERYYFEF